MARRPGFTAEVDAVKIDTAELLTPQSPVIRGLRKAGAVTIRRARQNLIDAGKVRTGKLIDSFETVIDARGETATMTVINTARYACVLGGNTRVVTDKGTKGIGQIKVGDLVLTQSGSYHPVTATSRFPVTEKPDLVEIRAPWRRGYEHAVTVTDDHKILVHRDGRLKWVEAGDLAESDLVHVRTKVAHNRGAGPVKICQHCQAEYQQIAGLDGRIGGQGKRFCGFACRDDYWRANGHFLEGRTRPPEFCARMTELNRARFAANPESHPNRTGTRPTRAEKTLGLWLVMRGLNPIPKPRVGRLWPDFYVESEHRIYEADGAYWHRDQAKDIARDRALQAAMPGVEVVHVHFFSKRHSPRPLDPNPLPGVWYVAVNPSPESYVEPTVFHGVHPTSIRKFSFERKNRGGGGTVPYLYDLSVEGEHSFLASGILVSNSYVHSGTPRDNPGGRIYPKRKQALRFRPVAGGPFVFAASVKGVLPFPYLQDAIDQLTPADYEL